MSNMKRQHDKFSVGIACCKLTRGNPQILLVKKRVSYCYADFVQGKYDPTNTEELKNLLNNMTVDEKICISSLDFTAMWYRIWMDFIPKYTNFYAVKNKFEMCFKADGGVRIKSLIQNSASVQPLWEIPKGRKDTLDEPEISCAVREFQEETGLKKAQYKIIPDVYRDICVMDRGVRYRGRYYIAVARDELNLASGFSNSQIEEISECRWMSLNEIRLIDCDGTLLPLCKSILNCAKKRTRGG